MNISLKKLLIEKGKELPSNLIKFADFSEVELLKTKEKEIQYMESLKSRLNDLKRVSIIADQATRLIEEEKINDNANYYSFRYQLGTFRHKNEMECAKKYVPLISN